MIKRLLNNNLDNFFRTALATFWTIGIGFEMLNTWNWWVLTGELVLWAIVFGAILFVDVT